MARTKKACIIFFDEVDAIGGARFFYIEIDMMMEQEEIMKFKELCWKLLIKWMVLTIEEM